MEIINNVILHCYARGITVLAFISGSRSQGAPKVTDIFGVHVGAFGKWHCKAGNRPAITDQEKIKV
jgi:hypothetical protein